MKPKKALVCLLVLPAIMLSCVEGAERDQRGQIVFGGDVKSTSLRTGDCFQDWEGAAPEGSARILNLDAVPCDEPHDNEVFHTREITGKVEWPGEQYLRVTASVGCLGAFESFVGRDHASSRLDYGYMRPTRESWENSGDRRITCFLFDAAYAPLVGSMRGSGE